MARARSTKVDLDATPFYHVISRCVRKSYLCGIDHATGVDYNYRKSWIVTRMKQLADVFAINVCAYAVMSNHYHIVLHIDQDQVTEWQDEEVAQRWSTLFPRNYKEVEEQNLSEEEKEEKITLWRERLHSISWFMRCLNEEIAVKSNKEENMTGRFWEERFKSQALLDEGALLTAMTYVDLNPIRAKIADRPETSEFTSIYERIKSYQKGLSSKNNTNTVRQPQSLMPFRNTKKQNNQFIDFCLKDYLELVDNAGRIIRENKRGAIPDELSPILHRLNLKSSQWMSMLKDIEHKFFNCVGNASSILSFKTSAKKVPKGYHAAMQWYVT